LNGHKLLSELMYHINHSFRSTNYTNNGGVQAFEPER
jgi:hypothetical protein